MAEVNTNPGHASIFPLSVSHLVTDIYMPVIPAVLPLLIADRGLTFFLAGLLVTSYNLTSSATQPLFGWLSDRHGKQVHVSTSLLISAVFIGLIGVVGSYPLLLACASLAAIGHACFHPNALSLVSRIATAENRGRVTSLFVVGGNIGYAIGPLLAGGVVALFGLQGLLFLVIPALIMAVILRMVLPRGTMQAPAASPGTDQARVSFSPLASLFAASTLRACAVFTAVAFFPALLISRGFNLFSANLMITLMLFAGVAGQISGGILADAYGKKEFTIISLLCSIPFLLIFLGSTGTVSYLALIVFGFFLWSSFAVSVAMSHEIMPSRVGIASGLMLGVAIGAGGIGVAINGMIADTYSLATALYTIPVLLVGAALLMFLVRYPWKMAARIRAM